MAEHACRAYLAEYLADADVVLTAYTRRECADLSRRVQGYLLGWGQLCPDAATELRDGARAYAGDLVVARDNDNHVNAGGAGRPLANSDVLRVDAVGDHEMRVCRLDGHDRATGQRP